MSLIEDADVKYNCLTAPHGNRRVFDSPISQPKQNYVDKEGVTQFQYDSTGHPRLLLRSFDDMRKTGSHTDLVLKCGGEEYPCHKLVLAGGCEYFHAMFKDGTKESNESVVELRELTPVGLERILQFLYTGAVSISDEHIEDVLAAARYLQVNWVVDACAQHLFHILDTAPYQIFDILILFERYGLEQDIQELILDDFSNHLSVMIMPTDQWQRDSSGRKFLEAVCQFTDLQKASSYFKTLLENGLLRGHGYYFSVEFELFVIFLLWMAYNFPSRKHMAEELLVLPKYNLMTAEELCHVKTVDVAMSIDAIKSLVEEAVEYVSAEGHAKPLMQSNNTIPRSANSMLVAVNSQSCFQDKTDGTCIVGSQLKDMCNGEDIEWRLLAMLNNGDEGEINYPGSHFDSFAIAALGNHLYITGGSLYLHTQPQPLKRVLLYSPLTESGELQDVAPMQTARYEHCAVSLDDMIYVVGGVTDHGMTSTDSVESYNPNTNIWVHKEALPIPLRGHASATCQGAIFISGGELASEEVPHLFSYLPHDDNWTEKSPMLSPRARHSMAASDNKLYIVGGTYTNGEEVNCFLPIECYNLAVDQWCLVTNIRKDDVGRISPGVSVICDPTQPDHQGYIAILGGLPILLPREINRENEEEEKGERKLKDVAAETMKLRLYNLEKGEWEIKEKRAKGLSSNSISISSIEGAMQCCTLMACKGTD